MYPAYLRFPHVMADQVAFTAEDDVWLAPLAGGRARRMTADGVVVARPRLSPDGSMLAWISRRAGAPEAFVMPVDGGLPRQLSYFGHPSTTLHGFGPDGQLILISAGSQPFRSRTWAYAIDVADPESVARRLPLGPVNAVADSGRGPIVVGTGYLRDPAHWKRYRGGTAGRLWLDPLGTGDFEPLLPELAGPKTSPVWTGDRLAFLADFEGHGNVYSVAFDGPVPTDLRRHTDHQQFYARQLTGDGSTLVYQHAGRLWAIDDPTLAADSQPRSLGIQLGGTRAGRAPRPVQVSENITTVSVDDSGRASALDVRGSVVWLTHRGGPATVLASSPGVRNRLPVPLGRAAVPADGADGPRPLGRVAYVTDADGADAIEVRDGTSVHRIGSGELGRVIELRPSPDGATLAVSTHDGRLLAVDVAAGAVRELAANPNGEPSGLAFSPDSRWLAFSAAGPSESLRSIQLCELSTGAITAVTDVRFLDSNPSFSPDGKFLLFLSARTFDPVYDAHVFDLAFPLATRPYLVTLSASTPSPFEPELAGRPALDTPPEPPEKSGAAAPVDVVVDLDRIAERVVAFPVAAGRLGDLIAVKGGVIWTDTPLAGELGESRNPGDDVRASLQRWDFGTRKQLELAAKVDLVAAAGDGTRLVLRDGDTLTVVPADHPPAEGSGEAVEIDLSRVRFDVDPAAEWRQMFDETSRLMREHYWIEDMAGVDWDAEVDKYRPLLDAIAGRDDLSDLVWEINGETGSSHAYETPKPAKPNPLLKQAYLGADLSYVPESGWVIERILHGDNSARAARSPLTAPAVAAQAGDVLIAVNGRPVGAAGIGPLLLGNADKPVSLTLSRAGVERSVVITPLADDTELRYLDWVSTRRAAVHERTGGRVGYLHIPDMVSSGWAAFHRDLAVEMVRDALIVDTRDNAGGHTSELVIEKLSRRVLAWMTPRHYPQSSYAGSAPRGPLLSIANEWSGSDGDIVNAAFNSLELGPILGTRTWGGVIGIDGKYSLIDGTSVTQPRYAFWFEKFGWDVENHGVDPDVVVEFPPQAWGEGTDPQLAAAIELISSSLEAAEPLPRPDLSTRPSRRAPELPPRMV